MTASIPSTGSTPAPVTAGAIGFTITGMHCGSCAARAQRELAAVPGVGSASVAFEGGRAVVETVTGFGGWDSLAAAVTRAGYVANPPVETPPHETPGAVSNPAPSSAPTPSPAPLAAEAAKPEWNLRIDGMSCASCVTKVTAALAAVPGVGGAEVNFGTHRAVVRGSLSDASSLVQAVRAAGYGAEILAPDDDQADPAAALEADRARAIAEAREWRLRFFCSAIVSGVLMISHPMGFPGLLGPFQAGAGTVIQFWAGARFYRGALRGARARTANMDSLIALGTTAAWAHGLWLYFHQMHAAHEFMTATMILSFVSLGKWIETRGRLRAGDAVRLLLELAPSTAMLVREGGGAIEVEARGLRPGDRCRVATGGRLPTDGRLEERPADLNEAMLTGEAMPVTRKPGDHVFGGTINTGPPLTMRVEKTGSETALRQIARRVGQAMNTRPRMQALADRVSAWFVPAVVLVALATLAACLIAGVAPAEAVSRAVAVLIVACPCAMGLATPLAVMAGVGAAARHGIIIRSAETLETSGSLDTILFDKTGTLTLGEPEVTGLYPAPDHEPEELLAAAASIEAESTHPLGRAIVTAARARGLPFRPLENVVTVAGGGLRSARPPLVLGSAEFLRAEGVVFRDFPAELLRHQARGETIIGLGVPGGGTLAGGIALADRLRAGSAAAVRSLGAMGLRTVLISGDGEGATRAVAQLLGIDDVRWRVAPSAKADAVRQLQQKGARVAMVGDGINDAPALAQADLGIAMAGGSDIAQQAAGLTLLSGDPRQIAVAIRLARAIRRKMIQNLCWAIGYNALLIPPAAFGLLQPIHASAAMALSSVSVVGNALLLYRWRKP